MCVCSWVFVSASCRFGINSTCICCINRSDFLSLPFQAIECSLAGVRPKGNFRRSDQNSFVLVKRCKFNGVFLLYIMHCLWYFLPGDEWTEAALDDFDRLTYCASWRPLLAKLCSYSHSDLSSWPSVKLYDNSEGKVSKSLFNLLLCLVSHPAT